MHRALFAIVMVIVLLGAASAPLPADTPSPATFADGSSYVIEVPSNWNGTLLLYSHGYRMHGARNPASDEGGEIADLRPVLLARGYALAGSSYAGTGYDVADALHDQMSTLDEFVRRYGRPKRTIAWGHSLGGLISIGLVERHPDRFDGALSMCAPLAGSGPSWNQLLDSEFVLKALADPKNTLQVANITDAGANLAASRRVVANAMQTPAGRARLALAAAFNEEPSWAPGAAEAPSVDDTNGRLGALLANFREYAVPFGFFARQEIEQRAHGNPSSNVGESYLNAFRALPERSLIVTAYKNAGLDLEADLRAVDAMPRIPSDPMAAGYLKANTDVGETLPVPIVTMHTIADGLAPVEHERNYAEAVPVSLRASHLRQLFVKRAGHCAFTSAETLVALESLIGRMRNGSWTNLDPVDLNAAAHEYGDGLNSFVSDSGDSLPVPPGFVEYVPKAFLR